MKTFTTIDLDPKVLHSLQGKTNPNLNKGYTPGINFGGAGTSF